MTNDLRQELTLKPFVLPDYDFGIKKFPVYRHSQEFFYVPKFYGIDKFGPPDESEEREGSKISVEFKGELRPKQKLIVGKILQKLHNDDSCVLSLGCGFGKTTISLYLLSKLKLKTLVIVHKSFLMDQWKERILQFLPNARVGILRQNKVEVDDVDITIGMLQSISMKEYPKDTFDSFSCVVVDECHRICSRTFSKALSKVATKKMLGLSATPERKDGLTSVLTWFLGEIYAPVTERKIETPTVEFLDADYLKEPEVVLNVRGKVNLPRLITQIASDPTRTGLILSRISELLKEKRKILILTERRQQCEDIVNSLGNEISGMYVGGMKEAELTESNTKNVIAATYSMASEGYDCATLDTLIMATSRSEIEQSVGRILRRKNDNDPLIIDVIDDLDGLRGQASKRKRWYRKNKFKGVQPAVDRVSKKFLFTD